MNLEVIIEKQKKFVNKLKIDYCKPNFNHKMGVSKTFLEKIGMPINGLRHPLTKNTTGWFLWAGELSDNIDFFLPIHTSHIYEKHPEVQKYLGLPPGFRFLFDNEGYEDIWKDDDLLLDDL